MGQCNNGEDQKISIGEFPLTRSGRELSQIASKEKMSGEYIVDVVELVKKAANSCKFSLHRVNSRNGDTISYNEDEITAIETI